MKVTTFGWWTYPNRFLNIQNPPNTWCRWVFGTPKSPIFQEMWMGVQSYLLQRCFFWCLGKKREHLSFQNMVFGFWGKCEAKKWSQLTLKSITPNISLNKTDDPPPLLWSHSVVFFGSVKFFVDFLTKKNRSTSTTKKHSKWVPPGAKKAAPCFYQARVAWTTGFVAIFLGEFSVDFLVGIHGGILSGTSLKICNDAGEGFLHPEGLFSKL